MVIQIYSHLTKSIINHHLFTRFFNFFQKISNKLFSNGKNCDKIGVSIIVLALYVKGEEFVMANILVVDDAAFVRMTLKKMLEAHGHTVIGDASNGLEGITKYKALSPDVVLLDLTMPEMDGMDALKLIKAYDSKAKVVVCTALGQHTKVAEAIENGATDFIVKPFDEKRIAAAIEKVMKM